LSSRLIQKKLKIKIYKTVILSVVTLREGHGLRVFENSVLRIFGSKREEDGSWRKLHNDELHSLYSSTNIFRVIKLRRMSWAGHVACVGEGRGVYRILIGRHERDHWEDLGIGGWITLRWTLRR
jgi:hypothetical protein